RLRAVVPRSVVGLRREEPGRPLLEPLPLSQALGREKGADTLERVEVVEDAALLVSAPEVRLDGEMGGDPGARPVDRRIARGPPERSCAEQEAREPVLGHARV